MRSSSSPVVPALSNMKSPAALVVTVTLVGAPKRFTRGWPVAPCGQSFQMPGCIAAAPYVALGGVAGAPPSRLRLCAWAVATESATVAMATRAGRSAVGVMEDGCAAVRGRTCRRFRTWTWTGNGQRGTARTCAAPGSARVSDARRASFPMLHARAHSHKSRTRHPRRRRPGAARKPLRGPTTGAKGVSPSGSRLTMRPLVSPRARRARSRGDRSWSRFRSPGRCG